MNKNAICLLTTIIFISWSPSKGERTFASWSPSKGERTFATNQKRIVLKFWVDMILEHGLSNKKPALDSPVQQFTKMVSQSSLENKIEPKNNDLTGTAPQKHYQDPTTVTYMDEKMASRTMRGKLLSHLLPVTTTDRASSDKHGSAFEHLEKHQLFQLFLYEGSESPSEENSLAGKGPRSSDSTSRVLKREFSATTESTVTGNTAEENGTVDSDAHQSTAVTPKPENEEFVPGMTKSIFITVTSSSVMITSCVAVMSLYLIRRRRLRMMNPERQRLIPFRIYTGIYYNQTGPCF